MGPPITAVRFMSDAAGAAYSWADGRCTNLTEWTFVLMTKLRDSRGRLWGSKSSTLECFGLLIPFVTRPDLLRKQICDIVHG